MSFFNVLKCGASTFLNPSRQSAVNVSIKRFRKRLACDMCLRPPDKKPCLDIKKVIVERGNQCHANILRLFLYTHYWPREPSVVGLWMTLDSPYLDALTEKYAYSGDRFLAFEKIPRTGEDKLLGVSVANKVYPWATAELEEWALNTSSVPERTRMFFIAHCLKSSRLMEKYGVDFIYEVEVLATDAEVSGRGVGTLLLQTALDHASDLGYPLTQIIAVNHHAAKCCEKCGMKREWSMDYSEYVDYAGKRLFFPRRPHNTVAIYTKFIDISKPREEPCKPQYY